MPAVREADGSFIRSPTPWRPRKGLVLQSQPPLGDVQGEDFAETVAPPGGGHGEAALPDVRGNGTPSYP